MEARYICAAPNQSARAIAAGTIEARDHRIEHIREPISAAVARDPEIFPVNPARRRKKSSLRITKIASERGTVVRHRRELQIARAQTREDSNARTIAASIWKRASSGRDLSMLIVNSISQRAHAALGAGRCMRRFGYGTWRDPCRKDP